MTCPNCGGSNVRLSRKKRVVDVLQRTRGKEAYRCRTCLFRFHAVESAAGGPTAAQSLSSPRRPKRKAVYNRRKLKRLLVVVGIFFAALLVFLFFVRYITTEKNPDPDGVGTSSLPSESDSSPASFTIDGQGTIYNATAIWEG